MTTRGPRDNVTDFAGLPPRVAKHGLGDLKRARADDAFAPARRASNAILDQAQAGVLTCSSFILVGTP